MLAHLEEVVCDQLESERVVFVGLVTAGQISRNLLLLLVVSEDVVSQILDNDEGVVCKSIARLVVDHSLESKLRFDDVSEAIVAEANT